MVDLDSLGVWPDWDIRFPPYWGELRLFVFRRDGYRCTHCHKRFGQLQLDAHHIVPKEEGGSDNPKNLTTMCEPCHNEWHDAWIREEAEDAETAEDDEPFIPPANEARTLVGYLMADIPIYRIRTRRPKREPTARPKRVAVPVTVKEAEKLDIEDPPVSKPVYRFTPLGCIDCGFYRAKGIRRCELSVFRGFATTSYCQFFRG